VFQNKGEDAAEGFGGEVTDWGKTERDSKDGMRIQGWKDE
jgi:hypothetical protein